MKLGSDLSEDVMKKLELAESLKRAFAYGEGGLAECLHVARPCVLKVEVAVEKLRKMGKEAGR